MGIQLHCLHGTLQSPAVWAGLEEQLRSAADREVQVVAEPVVPPARGGLAEWAVGFCRRVCGGGDAGGTMGAADDSESDGPARALLGYSLGGRLAMHVLLHCPERWAAAILVAAHPGTDDDGERASIRERDRAWAARCRSEPLEAVLSDWDELPVFAGRPNRAPRSRELGAERQARAFEAFSRGRQADLRDGLSRVALPPSLYLTGSDDVRYGRIGEELAARLPAIRHQVIPDAGHRVPWDRPDAFAAAVGRFLVAS